MWKTFKREEKRRKERGNMTKWEMHGENKSERKYSKKESLIRNVWNSNRKKRNWREEKIEKVTDCENGEGGGG